MTPVNSAEPPASRSSRCAYVGGARDVAGVPEGLQFRNQIDAMAARVLGKQLQLFGRDGIVMGHQAGDSCESQCGSLMVGQAKVKAVHLPVRTELDDPAVVIKRLWDAGGIHHQAAHFCGRCFERFLDTQFCEQAWTQGCADDGDSRA